MANLLTHGNESLCYHDALGQWPAPELLVHNMKTTSVGKYWVRCVGDSDSALLLHAERIRELVPDARWVFVRRKVAESCVSFFRHFKAYPGAPREPLTLQHVIETAEELYKQALSRTPGALEVKFEDLDKAETVRKVWEHCLPNLDFPDRRAQLLQEWQVNVMERKIALAPEFLSK